MSDNICAVVVTYNRKELLRRSLQALLGQSRKLSRILVVNNVSSDGTLEMLSEDFLLANYPDIEVMTLPANSGGAGGFHAGLKHAFDRGFDWIWLLDDDAIAQPEALERLLIARDSFPPEDLPLLLASKITLPDGAIDPATTPWLKRGDMEQMCRAAERGTLALRVNAFVAVLVHRSVVARYGLPIASYFIWLDDVEYTARILRHEFGVLVPDSIVVHQTTGAQRDPGPRFYYSVRNQLWMIRHSSAWTGEEKLRLLAALLRSITQRLFRPPFSWEKLKVICRGLLHGIFQSPS